MMKSPKDAFLRTYPCR